jgi:hypothetical protein
MKHLCKNSLGLVVGTIFGVIHLLWAVAVAAKIAKPMMDWVLSMHFVNFPYVIAEFELAKAAMLVVMTFVVGYVVGWLFAAVWNLYCKKC